MKRLIKLWVFVMLCCHLSNAQSSLFDDEVVSKFSIHTEASFSILANSNFSLNAEVKLLSSESQDFQLNARVGFGHLDRWQLFDDDDNDESGNVGHLGIGFLIGQDNVFFEAYAGAMRGSLTEEGNIESKVVTLPSLDIGVRYQKPGAGVFYRLKVGLYGIGAGLGYAF